MNVNELKMIELPVSSLKGYDKNPRKNDAVVARMVESIKEFGFRIPVVAKSDGSVIDGHLRLKAAQRIGLKSVPVVLADELTEAQVKAFRLLANRSANWADWDNDLLKFELQALDEMDFDLSLTGFDDTEIDALLTEDVQNDGKADDTDVIASDVFVRFGDIFQIGKHRVVCGDSSSPSSIEAALNGDIPGVVVFDPPYENKECWEFEFKSEKAIVFTDFKHIFDAMTVCRRFSHCYQFIWDGVTSWYTGASRPLARHKTAFFLSNDGEWNFDNGVYFDGKRRTEKIVSNTRGSCAYSPLKNGMVHLQTVFQQPNTTQSNSHKHTKPVEWFRALIGGAIRPGGVVLDMFGGGGTSIAAAHAAGCSCRVIELDPESVQKCIGVAQAVTGVQAVKVEC